MHVEKQFQQKNFPGVKTPEPGEPVRFVMEVATETREVRAPFDFTDLPLP